ncbi:integrator complex subunit 3 homolog isoform X2 [Durio zibethinus]|uniref:Integrator complex subunit 3 homolog isoform X2 n=1 Tax=Durio zibethinus TaxID=66656 RepID=A0A6P5YDU7_DURZI|nr:integrator complex subunit 3 homolog isoform X2 [Durio zibethinus]
MASGSSGRANLGGSKGFDFGSDDILCSYEDYGIQESSNGSHAESVIGTNSSTKVHRSVQILRDKQELADTQKQLAKLQLVQKESSSSHSQSTEERASPPASDSKRTDHISEMRNQQLALALPHQVAPPQNPVVPHSQAPPQNLTQQTYYIPSNQLSNAQAAAPNQPPLPAQAPAPAPTQHPQSQYIPSDPQYRTPQIQDISRMLPQPTQSQVNQVPPVQSFPQYQQQWSQQLPQQVLPQQQSSMQPQMRPPSTPAYPPYPPSQSTNPSPPEALPNSMPMQVPYSSGVPQPVSSRADTIPYGYGVPGRKGTFGAQPADVYMSTGSHPPLPPGSAYMMYGSEGGRTHHPPQQPHFSQGGYPQANVSIQTQPGTGPNVMIRNTSHSQLIRNPPYNDLIENLVSMGFRSDHVASVIQRMEESGLPVDHNAVLDRLNVHSSGGSQRGGW